MNYSQRQTNLETIEQRAFQGVDRLSAPLVAPRPEQDGLLPFQRDGSVPSDGGFTLTATNETRHNVTVWLGPNTDAFSVTQCGKVVWRSNSGVQALYVTAKLLDPGESLALTANRKATTTGTFVVSNDLARQGPVATFSVVASQPTSVV